jgi:hypothetical protein
VNRRDIAIAAGRFSRKVWGATPHHRETVGAHCRFSDKVKILVKRLNLS